MTDGENRPAPTVWPGLHYRDARTAIRILVDVFGFEEAFVVDGVAGDVEHAELHWPEGGAVMLGSTDQLDGTHDKVAPGGNGVYVVTDDPDAVYRRVTESGVDVAEKLHETDYGSRTFTARDPEGNLWTFGTYRGQPRVAGC